MVFSWVCVYIVVTLLFFFLCVYHSLFYPSLIFDMFLSLCVLEWFRISLTVNFFFLCECVLSFVADVTVKNLDPIIKTVMTCLITAIKELVFVW